MARTNGASTSGKKTPTKKDELIRLLRAKTGADVATLGESLSWQPHTVRAAITGLRKAGHVVVATKPTRGGSSRYRIMSPAEQTEAEKPQPTAVRQEEAAQAAKPAETPDAR